MASSDEVKMTRIIAVALVLATAGIAGGVTLGTVNAQRERTERLEICVQGGEDVTDCAVVERLGRGGVN